MLVAFRTEGNHEQGMGDVWGSLALAQEFSKRGDECVFVLSGGETVLGPVHERGFECRLVSSERDESCFLEKVRPDAVVVNKLNNEPDYIRFLKSTVPYVVTIDDSGPAAALADLRINVLYETSGAVTDLAFMPLRDEFIAIHDVGKEIHPQVKELLVCQGGSDTYGHTPKIIRSLEDIHFRPLCSVVVGPAFRHDSELKEAVASSSLNLRVLRNAKNMSELMHAADLAITAGGNTMLELCCAGTPSIVVCGDRWELETSARLARLGAVVDLGAGFDLDFRQIPVVVDSLAADAAERERMSRIGKSLIDGRGCERSVELIRERVKRAAVDRI